MADPVVARGLFESHLSVADPQRSLAFYRDVVGLEPAGSFQAIGAEFVWIGGRGDSMLGLWSRGAAPLSTTGHIAFEASLEDVLAAPARLRELGVTPLDFDGAETAEPSVLGWMPAAAVYFEDPDGHLLEYLAMLSEPPAPDRGIVPW